MIMHMGITGELRCVITGADGSIKSDTGYQKNLILNQGLDFFGGGKGGAINAYCAIGSGNSAPVNTQNQLDVFIAIAEGSSPTTSYNYIDDGSGLYKLWEQKRYRFTGLNNINISEVGLVSSGITSTDYYLTTRALIKDSSGAPTSITITTGETLDVYYKIHKVIDVSDKSYVISVLNGSGGSVPYNVVIRPNKVGDIRYSEALAASLGQITFLTPSSGELTPITQEFVGAYVSETFTKSAYVAGSYKVVITISLGLSQANINIRSIHNNEANFFLPFQMRFGRVSDDAPLTKTNKETLSIPLEFSWGRYEGAL